MSCSVSTTSNHTDGFDFAELFTVYLYLNQTCPPESDIFFPGSRMMTEAACRKIAGLSDSIWAGWTAYPISDIWTRVVTWKLPLLQLVFQYPRPPLGHFVETATVTHLLGDPIDSITSMLVTLEACRRRAEQAKQVCSKVGICLSHPKYERTWKALAIIMVSYDECGKSESAVDVCDTYCTSNVDQRTKKRVQIMYETTANSLAADRSTKSLPVTFAEVVFIGGWVIALLKAAATEPNPTNWANVEAQSIAISALYLWVTFAVVCGSVIGASQSEDSIPRILQQFELNMTQLRQEDVKLVQEERQEDAKTVQEDVEESLRKIMWCKRSIERAACDGMYSWRPTKWKAVVPGYQPSTIELALYSITAILVVGCGFLTAAILSFLIPPKGPSCRHIVESLVFIFWFLSFVVGALSERSLRKGIFWVILGKDTFVTLATITMILVTQWGIMNRCQCWSTWGLTGVNLPQQPEVEPELMHFIRHVAPWITFMAILFQLVFCALVAWRYWDAVRVYIQRDDGLSNRVWRSWRVQEQN